MARFFSFVRSNVMRSDTVSAYGMSAMIDFYVMMSIMGVLIVIGLQSIVIAGLEITLLEYLFVR